MNFPHFVRIDRERRGHERHYVVHTQDPKFTLELSPDHDAPDRVGRGVIRRVCVPNSWAGDYGRYAKLLGAAQQFFAESNPARHSAPDQLPLSRRQVVTKSDTSMPMRTEPSKVSTTSTHFNPQLVRRA